ncbi:MAG TPA: lipid-transfer protein [Actinomycetota bacterium]|jgi:acetyl-CoA acetyltransferase|nr:lipid-transfer protein [Actinomycetota bacterium]
MGRQVFVVGVGMTKFEKPQSKDWDYPDMAKESITRALEDADLSYDKIEQACVGYVYGESTCGQRAVYQFGLTGIPVYNVNNNCSTGSTALFMARQLVEGGLADCVLAVGFEKMQKGSLGATFSDRTNPMDKHITAMIEKREFTGAPPAPWMFGNAGRDHMERYGTKAEQFAWIGWKNHKHSVNNPYAQFQNEYSLQEILDAPMIYEPLTKLQCSPTSDGSAAAILCSEEFVRQNGLEGKAVEIVAQAMASDTQATYDGGDSIHLVGYDMSKTAADKVYAKAGLGPQDVDVIELHDCFSANELITYEALGLAEEGKAAQLVDDEATTYGGEWVVNPSGGLISKGHPLGATGLAQCAELNWQVRGEADKRQVDGAKIGLQHNIGLGGACVVTMYRKAS